MIRIGLDVGSTTLKSVVLDESGAILYQQYERHYSQITLKVIEMLSGIQRMFPDQATIRLCISGSAGMGLAQDLGIPFAQEVYATREAVNALLPGTDVVIELGGEDAKILFLSGAMDVCMNGSCAGGTGAFIDQMATLLDISQDEMNALATNHKKIYSIASRCGVFAKSDVQPLLNQGATKEDVSASIFTAVANQTIAGLAHGRQIEGRVVYLGGPLTFFSALRATFDDALRLKGTCPKHSLYFVAYGAALLSQDKTFSFDALLGALASYTASDQYAACAPLFESEAEYEAFAARHSKQDQQITTSSAKPVELAVGIDAGSTTLKAVAIDTRRHVVFSRYMPNAGNPVPLVKSFLEQLYAAFPQAKIVGSATTGYGEEIIKNAFHADYGLVETIAHYTAARQYDPDVDFIIDIGGQDIKCFQIRNGAIDNIFLNEACSSGCGSFLQTFAGALGYSIEDFSRRGLFANRPVDLGSRCTVFMNSSVKQAQKDGATIENIAAGLSISVVKNALYKVIRMKDKEEIGRHVIVQGGTFLNDSVLRAFEKEIGRDVIRPALSGLMGAYGAALYALDHRLERSGLLDGPALQNFRHQVMATTCKGCTNHCRLTINTFSDGRRFIGGNQCEKPTRGQSGAALPSMFEVKKKLLDAYSSQPGRLETIGLLMGLNEYELLPFWHTLLTELGFGVELSGKSNKKLYHAGQNTISSDTVCYPAKLMHGHLKALLDKGVEHIFYPCLSYNMDEQKADNHYNCPVVAYYPEVLRNALPAGSRARLLHPYLGIHRRKDFPKHFRAFLNEAFDHDFSKKEVAEAAEKAYARYEAHLETIHNEGDRLYQYAVERNLPIIVLCGRPYHLDEEVNHGIDKFVTQEGAVLLSEDSLGHMVKKVDTDVLNQWTYHARLYSAADFVNTCGYDKIDLVQLVSFGCGLDAITTDEVRAILESNGKIYTQIKIDEITNLGAVKIRLRSLFAAAKEKRGGTHV